MTVLAADASVARKFDGLKAYPVKASTQIYKGSLVTVDATGYAIAAADTAGTYFVGIAAENALGTAVAGAVWIKVWTRGEFLLPAVTLTQAMVGTVMYVSDSGAFTDTAANVPCGKLVEYIGASLGWLDINCGALLTTTTQTPNKFIYANMTVKIDNYTVVAVTDQNKVFGMATAAKVFTLPACTAGQIYTFVNTGADANNVVDIDPQAADGIGGGGLTGVANKYLRNTAATAKFGDYVTIVGMGAGGTGVLGWLIVDKQGIWAKEG
jgi:hypothetical protein